MAIDLTATLFRNAQDLPSSVLDHFFAVGFCLSVRKGSILAFLPKKLIHIFMYRSQVVRARQPPCAYYEPASQVFVHDHQAYEAYQRGKATVPSQVSLV
jgi:hypothetical protein